MKASIDPKIKQGDLKGILGNQIQGMLQNKRRNKRVSTKNHGRLSKMNTNRGLMPEIKEDDKEELTDDELMSPEAAPVI